MASAGKMQVFRRKDAPALMETEIMSMAPMTAVQEAGVAQMIAAGAEAGDKVRVLVNMPGFTLAHVWFGQNYPLPLHSHDTDCLYYIVKGSLQLGVEALEAGDSFFVPANAPYAYTAGPEGVEVLEFRHATTFDFRNHAKNAAFYDKAQKVVAANRDSWAKARAAQP